MGLVQQDQLTSHGSMASVPPYSDNVILASISSKGNSSVQGSLYSASSGWQRKLYLLDCSVIPDRPSQPYSSQRIRKVVKELNNGAKRPRTWRHVPVYFIGKIGKVTIKSVKTITTD
jgi:hypothetical protein